jgi:hypothetical protein
VLPNTNAVFANLSAKPNYGFTTIAGNISSRFALHFGLSITDSDGVASNIGVYAADRGINVLLRRSKDEED